MQQHCRSSSTGVSTISNAYFEKSPTAALHFPYIKGHKYRASRSLFDLIHDGIKSGDGLASTLIAIQRRRKSRYMRLLALFHRLLIDKPKAKPPRPKTLQEYDDIHGRLDHGSATLLWLRAAEAHSKLSHMLMHSLEIRKLIRMDHSQKFPSHLKIRKADCARVNAKNLKLLLMVQNEIGQIVGYTLTESENHAQTRGLLEKVVRDRFLATPQCGDKCIICDNVNRERHMLKEVFGEKACVRQDPLHVIQRVSDHIVKGKGKAVAKQLSNALYVDSGNGDLRPPNEMSDIFQRVAASVNPDDIKTIANWNGCINSNIEQIKRGDLSVPCNTYEEGGSRVKIVSTSQLEGLHACLKRLLTRTVSLQVGLRMLDIFLMEYNLRIGAKFGRNPDIRDMNFSQLCQLSLRTHDANVSTSREAEFALDVLGKGCDLLDKDHEMPVEFRHTTSMDFPFKRWSFAFPSLSVDDAEFMRRTEEMEEKERRSKAFSVKTFRATSVAIDKNAVFRSLKLDKDDVEDCGPPSRDEYAAMTLIVRYLKSFATERHELERRKSPAVVAALFNHLGDSGRAIVLGRGQEIIL